MPWCPACKNEYVDGIKVCEDCLVELVDTLENSGLEPIIFGEEEEIERVKGFLEYSQIKTVRVKYDEEESVYELFVDRTEENAAKKAVAVFQQEEGGETDSEEKEKKKAVVYEDQGTKAENFKSSAYSLIGVGVLGAVVLLLAAMDILPFQLGTMTYGVMGIVFAVFIVAGILSFSSYKKSVKLAVTEKNLSEELKKWCRDSLTRENIDQGLFSDKELQDEMKYFKRTEKIKERITSYYSNLEEGFLEEVVEEVYGEIYDK